MRSKTPRAGLLPCSHSARHTLVSLRSRHRRRCPKKMMTHQDGRREREGPARLLRAVAAMVTCLVIASPAADAFAQTRGRGSREQRRITFNGGALDERGWRVLEQLQSTWRDPTPGRRLLVRRAVGGRWSLGRSGGGAAAPGPAAWWSSATACLGRRSRYVDGSVRERTRTTPGRRARHDRDLRSGVAGPVVGQRTRRLRAGRPPRDWEPPARCRGTVAVRGAADSLPQLFSSW